MPQGKVYSLKPTVRKKICLHGFDCSEAGRFVFSDSDCSKYMFFPAVDQISEDSKWGRLAMKLASTKDLQFTVYAMAQNVRNDVLVRASVSPEEKLEFFRGKDGLIVKNNSDFLLYSLQGRYLYVALEVRAGVEGELLDLKIINPGDYFMKTMPEIYHDENSIFHRYMSIFSGLHADIQDKIDDMPGYFDVNEAEAAMVRILAGWIGLELPESLFDDKKARAILKELPVLNKSKGTAKCLLRVGEIIAGPGVGLAEFGNFSKFTDEEADFCRSLNIQKGEAVLLVRRKLPPKDRMALRYMVEHFRPITCKVRIAIFPDSSAFTTAVLDTEVHMDEESVVMF